MPRKRNPPAWMRDEAYGCSGPALAEPLQVAGTGGDEPNPYELERQAIIERNKQRMVELGIPTAAQELAAVSTKPKKAPKAPKGKPTDVPAKRSKRISGERAPEASLPQEEEDDEDELVEEKPPKKRKASKKPSFPTQAIYEPRHPNLPSHYSGVQTMNLTSEEMRQQEEMKAANERLAAINLNGLKSVTKQKAEFVVKGSRGDNYLVALSDSKHTCQCMDHRIRKRDCKHIILILKQLGLDRNPALTWRDAVQDKFMLSKEEREQKAYQILAEAFGVSSSAVPATGAGGPGNGVGSPAVKADNDGLAGGGADQGDDEEEGINGAGVEGGKKGKKKGGKAKGKGRGGKK